MSQRRYIAKMATIGARGKLRHLRKYVKTHNLEIPIRYPLLLINV